MRLTVLLCLLGYVFWFALFSPAAAGTVDFWPLMVAATGVLAGTALFAQRNEQPLGRPFRPRDAVWGISSAVVLYGIFFVGNALVRKVLPSGPGDITRIYGIRAGYSPWVIGVLLLFWIGPAEEIFWRGFLQRRLSRRWGPGTGYAVSALIYGMGHGWSFNVTLVLASLVCGFFWGGIYLRTRSVWPGLISHAVWDLLIFIVFPLS